jgi:hypothetical protein
MQVKTSHGFKDVAIVDVTPENYIVAKGEEHLFHARIEIKKFDANTGERQSVPRIQKFGKKSFESGLVFENLKKQGYLVDILHNPNEWLEQNKAATEEEKRENERLALENQERLEKEAKQKEEEALKAKEEADAKKLNEAIAQALKTQSEQMKKENQAAIDQAVKAALASQSKAKAATETPAAKTGTGSTEKTDTVEKK